jgi:alanine or glycine:cation symporter, AGCS family
MRVTAMLAFFIPSIVTAATTPSGIDHAVESFVLPITDAIARTVFSAVSIGGVEVPLILGWLIAIALFCTFYFRFINFRGFLIGFRLIRGDYSDGKSDGETSHFQALATALSGTIGLGNIAGVALAIYLGGPGAAFWMIIAGILGMASKFCECTLGVKYRQVNADGTISGGPMYYLSRGIAEEYPRLKPLGKVLGFMFALFCIGGAIGAGNLFQSNGMMQALMLITGGEETSPLRDYGWLFGLLLAFLVGIVIVGGMKSIASVTDKLVPIMGIIYLLGGMVVIGFNIEHLPDAIMTIINGAFTPQGVAGGAVGVLLIGFRRAAFSNEAGIGTAAIAHSTVKTKHPVTEGLVATWEPFIDTVIICTMSALVIVISGVATVPGAGPNGVALTAAAFGSVVSWFPYVLAIAVFLFGYSTMISYAYYGERAAMYLFGNNKTVSMIYKLIFILATPIGTIVSFARLADFSDAVYFLMAIPNVIGMYLLAPVVKRELADFMQKLKSGEIKNVRVAPTELQGSP